MWTRHARSTVLRADTAALGAARWTAEHDGYSRAREALRHRRTVHLDRERREVRVEDEVRGQVVRDCRLAFHLGPEVTARLDGHTAELSWRDHTAVLELSAELSWTAHRGEENPPLGWYSTEFGHREPTTTLVGAGRTGAPFVTVLRFHR
jgi:hypothetical protein